jgi:hypothetical protein
MKNGRVQAEITERIKNAQKCYQLVRDIYFGNMRCQGRKKMCLLKNYYMPTLTYGDEIWDG